MKLDILIAGVGGQGTLFASRVLGAYAGLKGYDCKMSETHGMAQRGGSVITYVRFGDKIYSPLITDGQADVLLGFEILETYRYAYAVKKGGKIIANTQEVLPLPVIAGLAEYPQNLKEEIKKQDALLIAADAHKIALELGDARVTNTVMLGIFCAAMKFDKQKFIEALKSATPEKALKINLEAFEKGYIL